MNIKKFSALYGVPLALFIAITSLCDDRDANVQTLIASGISKDFDEIGRVQGVAPFDSGFLFIASRGDTNVLLVGSYSLEDRRIAWITNAPKVVPDRAFAFSCLMPDGFWTHTDQQMVRLSLDPKYRSIGYFSTIAGYSNANLSLSRFRTILGFAFETPETAIVLDAGNRRFRHVDFRTEVVTPISGNGSNLVVDGLAFQASIAGARFCARTPDGTIYFVDEDTQSVFLRRMNPDRSIDTVKRIGTGSVNFWDGPVETAEFGWKPLAFKSIAACPDGSIVIACQHTIRRIANGIVTTIAGRPGLFSDTPRDGPGNEARLVYPESLSVGADGSIYFLETGRVRRISFKPEIKGPSIAVKPVPAFSIQGTIGRTYRIEAADSADATQWDQVGQATLTKTPETWIDDSTTNQPRRFYRAVLLQ